MDEVAVDTMINMRYDAVKIVNTAVAPTYVIAFF